MATTRGDTEAESLDTEEVAQSPIRQPKVDVAVLPTRFRVPSLPEYWEQYLLCVMYHLVFPLLPLGAEFLITRRVSAPTWHLAAFTYLASVGTSSKRVLGLGFGLFGASIFAMLYGLSVGSVAMPSSAGLLQTKGLPVTAIAIVFILHALERYNRHVADREPFWEFTRRGHQ